MNHIGRLGNRLYRTRQAARLVSSMLALGVPLTPACELSADGFGLTLGEVLGAWGR